MMIHNSVKQIWPDNDGWWVELEKGFCIEGLHAVHQTTRKKLQEEIEKVTICQCKKCQQKSQGKKKENVSVTEVSYGWCQGREKQRKTSVKSAKEKVG